MRGTVPLRELIDLVSGKADEVLDREQLISGINAPAEASADELAFLSSARYRDELSGSRAAAILVKEGEKVSASRPLIRVRDPYLAFALIQRHFHPAVKAAGDRHATAAVDPSAVLANDVDVGANAVIGARVRIGAGSRIGAGCIVGDDVTIGEGCTLNARSVVTDGCLLQNRVVLQPGAVIGSDGFGYAWSGNEHLKIPQVGRVVLCDGVEIGANTCIDRGAIGDTVIETGVKLDNLIQIGHNVRIGAYSIMASQVGISGSTVIGRGCQVGGQVGIAGHIQIGDGCKLAAKSGVMGSLEAGGTYAGIPAMPHRMWLKVSAVMAKLPDLLKGMR